jgi:hypothetical protein
MLNMFFSASLLLLSFLIVKNFKKSQYFCLKLGRYDYQLTRNELRFASDLKAYMYIIKNAVEK